MDGQAFFPRDWYPRALQDLAHWYATKFKDELMIQPAEKWFSSMIALEVLFQLPFFFIAVYALLQKSPNDKNAIIRGDGLFRSLCMIYGSSTATTLIPIFGHMLSSETTTIEEKGVLLGFYLPYFIFPVWLVVIAVFEENVFGGTKDKKLS